MRVGQLIQSIDLTAGGTSTAFLSTVEALGSRPDLQVRAYAAPPVGGDPAWEQVGRDKGRFTLVSGSPRGLWPGPLGCAVVQDIEAGRIDLLHIHGVWSPDLMAAGKACLRRGVPYVWQPHGMLVREAYAQKRWKKDVMLALGMRTALNGATGFVYVTAAERDTSPIPDAVKADRRHVVPLPVSMPPMEITPEFRSESRRKFGLLGDAPVVVFMGRLHPVKRIDMAMRALSALPKDLATTRLLLIGGGEEEIGLRALASRLGVLNRVTFAGWARGDEKWRALAAGDVLTLNSVHENFGYVAVEALCVGTRPVLTTNLALVRELPEDNVLRGLAEPTDAGLAEGLARALRERDAATTLVRGRAWVQEHLSAEAIGARLGVLYAAAAGRGVRGGL